MIKNLVFLTILLSITRTVLTDADLQSQSLNFDQINPLYDDQQDLLEKDQDKRTIFSPSYANYGLAKHTGISANGKKVLLGYSAVDLKFVPVIKPVGIKHGYHYGRPRVHFRHPMVIKPAFKVHSSGWKPVVPISKPVIPVNVPPPPIHHVHKPGISLRPTEHVSHVHHVKPVHVPVPVHIQQTLPVRPAVPFHPIPAVPVVQPAPVAHVPHIDYLHTNINHVHYAPTGIAAPLLPAFKPSPLFEVSKPDLGVLPLGATFHSPLISHNVKPAVVPQFIHQPIATPVLPQPIAAVYPQPQPVLPQPIVPPRPILQAPQYPTGTAIEFHGTYHPVPINGQVPTSLLPAVPNPVQQFFSPPVNAGHPILPTTYHNFHSHNIPQQPQDFSQTFHPQLPVQPPSAQGDLPVPQNFFQQQLPESTASYFQQQAQHDQQQFYQQQLPENSAPHYFSQSVQSAQDQRQAYILNQQQQQQQQQQQGEEFDGQNAIQPGETDLQLPLHLPQHPLFNQQYQHYQDQVSQQSENVFRPSLTLEPPYTNRRSSDPDRSAEEDEEDDSEKK